MPFRISKLNAFRNNFEREIERSVCSVLTNLQGVTKMRGFISDANLICMCCRLVDGESFELS